MRDKPHTPRPPLITRDMADRDTVRVRVKRELERVITAVWWGVYTVEDAAAEFRGIANMMAKRTGVDPDLIDKAAIEWLDQEMERHEAEHEASVKAMTDAAFIALREGANQAEARRIVAQHAADRPLPPPQHLLTVALEAAAKQHRMANAWWKKRESAE